MGQYNTGMGTTPGMWEMVSETLHGEKLPEAINKAIHALCDATASLATWVPFSERMPTKEQPMELMCLFKDGSTKNYGWYIDEAEFLADGMLLAWLDFELPLPPNA